MDILPSDTDAQYRLGVDGGGTHSRAAVVNAQGELRGASHADAANFLRVGLEAAVGNIRRAVEQACADAGIETTQLAAACFGLAGVGNAKNHRLMLAALKAAFPQLNFTLETDARIALAGAADMQPGVVIIAGTGSISCGSNARGEFARAGGWGPAMGDEGSGYYIGRRALEAVVSAYDQRTSPTAMTDAVCGHFGVASPPELPPVIYESPIKVMREIAQLSKLVVMAAQAGDQTARDILKDAAKELARAAVAVIKQLQMESEQFRVAYVGGVFAAGEPIIKPLERMIHKFAPLAEVAPPLHPPVIGAVKLAARL